MSATTGDEPIPIGFGVGLIAAAVAATATDADAVVKLGLEVVGVAFRLAIAVQQNGRDIEDSDGMWSLVVSGFDPKELDQRLEEVNAKLQPLHRAYIGQVLDESVVVFGPPSTLDTLRHTPDLAPAITSPVTPVWCPIYGSHLPPIDASCVVGASPLLGTSIIQKSVFFALPSPHGPLSTTTLGELLRIAVAEIAHKPIQIEESIRKVAEATRATDKSDVIITTVGSTWDTLSVRGIFQQHGQSVQIGKLSPRPKPYGNDIDSIPSGGIAIVGMSGRFPESDTIDEFWHLLETGATTHQEIPSSRFCVNNFYDLSCSTHNALLARHGCFIKKPGDFDHRLFNISPREALQMDPVQRMLLMTTYEALEMAGYSPPDSIGCKRVAPRIATYFGQTTDDWKAINEQQGIDTHFLPAVNRSFGPGRLNHYFKWAGGFYSIDTGCSSSATALCLARDALMAGQCDAAVVGGGTLLNAPEWFAGLSQGGFLSPTGACKTYSDSADGYCRGEGVAVVVLKRLADAVRSKDNVLAVISGAARNCNAGAGSITHPGELAQASLYRRVLRQAAIQPRDVRYIEMHGTGTQAGDRTEMHALKSVFISPDQPRRAQPLIVGAVKANMGHSEAAAGVVSLIKAILILQHNSIPPQPGRPIALNPHLAPFFDCDIQLADGQACPRNGPAPRYIFLNNFDAAGGNVSLLIHDPPLFALPETPLEPDKRAYHVVVTSGRTKSAHEANKSRLLEFIAQNPDTKLADLAYTTTARRMHHVHRQAYAVSSTTELLHQLGKPHPPLAATLPPSAPTSSVVFAFTGQGSQHLGMGRVLSRTSPTFRRLLDSYQELCDAQGLTCQFRDVICGSRDATSAGATATERDLQVATVALEIALARYWQLLGLCPTLVIGHSLGEYAALCIAGVLSVCDALSLVYERATLIFGRIPPSEAGMLAVALPVSTLQRHLQDSAVTVGCEVTCLNSPSNTVVGGPVPAINALQEYLKSDEGIDSTRLQVQHAFHTRQMDPILDDLEAKASRVYFHPPTLLVASTLLGRIVQPGEGGIFNAKYLRRHTREPVAFFEAVRACEAESLIQDHSFVIEVGPHPTCIGLMVSSLQSATPTCYPSLCRGRNDWELISECLAAAYQARLPVSWVEFHKDYLDHLRMVNGLPTYAFDLKSFWFSYKTQRVPNNKCKALPHASTSESSRFSSTCLHAIENLQKDGNRLLAMFTVDLSDRHLARAIGGHVIDGVAICPASIFIDMAYTAAVFLEGESRPVSTSSLATYELVNLSMQTPLVIREGIEHPHVSLEGAFELSTDVVSVRFLSRREGAALPVEYGSCLIRLNQPEAPCSQAWSRMQPLVKCRMRSLDASSRPREVHSMDKRLFYKMFSEIVDYSTHFHAVEEAILAADFRDAAIVLQIASTTDLGTFTCNPFAIDALVHVAGFLLNADVRKPKTEIHIANHIGSLRVLGDLSSIVRGYATIREQDAKAGTSLCDVYAIDDQDKLVALCTDICFKKLERDFFALLTRSARSPPPEPCQRASPRCDLQQGKTASSSGSSATAASVGSSTTLSSLSDVVDLSASLLDAVAARSGISVAELKRSTAMTFSDMGIDSQMSIAILADFQKATAVELPAAFFINFPTLAAVEKELGSHQQADVTDYDRTSRVPFRALPMLRGHQRSPAQPTSSKQLFRLVTDALGLEGSDLTPSTTFASIGMDSMLSIKVISAFQHKTQIELPAAFFTDQQTVAAAREALDGPLEAIVPEGGLKRPPAVKPRHSVAAAAKVMSGSIRQHKIDSIVSRAVLIQGWSGSRMAPLFLTTDGSGTVESYLHLRALPEGRRIYGLESPFVKCPEAFDLSVEEMASVFIQSIRKVQPRGPYLLGGWSAGSIYAYETAHRLTMQGETITALLILDMRVPSLIPTSIITPAFVDKLGTFEGIYRARDLPEDLSTREKAHLMATCRALSRYDARAFPTYRQPRHPVVVWARLGLDNRKDAPIAAMGRPGLDINKPLHEMTMPEFERYFNSWFYGRREQFGTNGWETLLGDHILLHTVDGGLLIATR